MRSTNSTGGGGRINASMGSVLLIIFLVVSLLCLIFINRSPRQNIFFGSFQNGITVFIDTAKEIVNRKHELEVLKEEYLSLYESINATHLSATRIDSLAQENEELQQLIEARPSIQYQNTIAKIIARDPLNPYVFTIDKGADSGVEIDLPIAAFANDRIALVGKVVVVSTNFSRIETVTSSRFKTLAKHEKLGFSGIMSGTTAYNKLLSFEARDSSNIHQIERGDTIVSSHYSSIFPEGLMIGEIETISDSKNHDNNYVLAVKPYVDFSALNYVIVLKPVEIL